MAPPTRRPLQGPSRARLFLRQLSSPHSWLATPPETSSTADCSFGSPRLPRQKKAFSVPVGQAVNLVSYRPGSIASTGDFCKGFRRPTCYELAFHPRKIARHSCAGRESHWCKKTRQPEHACLRAVAPTAVTSKMAPM